MRSEQRNRSGSTVSSTATSPPAWAKGSFAAVARVSHQPAKAKHREHSPRRLIRWCIDDRSLASALEDLARRLGIEIRVEPVETREGGLRGGLCTIEGRRVLIVDSGASLTERVAVLADGLCREDLESHYLAPAVRERLNRALGEPV